MEEQSVAEKRAIRRFALQLPVVVKAVSDSGETLNAIAETRDVSSHGICFHCGSAMEPGAVIEFTVTLPAEVTMTEPISVQCRGKVVRVEKKEDGRFAVAAQIENYDFLASEQMQELVDDDDNDEPPTL